MGMTPMLSIFHFLLLSLSFPPLLAAAANRSKDKETPFVGVNIGTDVSNLFPPEDLVAFLKSQQITHIRLYDADTALLAALSGTGIRVVLGVPNNQLLALGSSNATAASWIARYVLPFHPSTSGSTTTSCSAAVPLALPHRLRGSDIIEEGNKKIAISALISDLDGSVSALVSDLDGSTPPGCWNR